MLSSDDGFLGSECTLLLDRFLNANEKRLEAYENVHVIGLAIDRDDFLSSVPEDASRILAEFFFVAFRNQILSPLYCKYNVYVDLCISVRHSFCLLLS